MSAGAVLRLRGHDRARAAALVLRYRPRRSWSRPMSAAPSGGLPRLPGDFSHPPSRRKPSTPNQRTHSRRYAR